MYMVLFAYIKFSGKCKMRKEIGNRTVCLLDGMELDIGKNRRKQIKQQLENYKGGRRMC